MRVFFTYLGIMICVLAYPVCFLTIQTEPSFYLPVCAGVSLIGFVNRKLKKIGEGLCLLAIIHAGYFITWAWDYIYPDFTYFISIIVFIISITLCLLILWVISARSE